MAANNSTLQIEVVSKGIAEAVRKLDSLGNAAGRNEAKVKLLTDSLGKLMTAQTSAVASASQHATTMNLIAQAMGMMATHATNTAAQVTNLNNQLTNLNATSNNTVNAFQRKSSAGGVVNSTLRAMTTAALAYLGLNFAKGIVEAADGWKMMQARLKLATGSMEAAKEVQQDLFNMAQRIRVPLEDAAKLYTRMAIPMQRMGQNAEQTAKQVEYVALALKLNGATAGEASSVMLQYSQAVNAGRLNGAEFNAVAEGAPGILRAIEAELKATSKWTEYSGKSLKQMGADGEITFDLMNRAAQRALPEMRKQFEQLPLTVDGAIQRIKNAWFKAMGEMGEKTDMGAKLAKAIGALEESIPKIRDALAGTFIFVYENFGKIVFIVEALIAAKLVMWAAGAATTLTAMATAATTTAAGVTVATGAVAAFGRGMAMMAGPLGIIIALVGVGLVQAYRAYSDMAPKTEASVTASTSKHVESRIAMIQAEINKIRERNGEAAKAVPKPAGSDGPSTDVTNQEAKIAGLKKHMDAATGGIKSLIEIDYNYEKKLLSDLVAVENAKKAASAAEAANIKASRVRGWESKFNLKTETKAEEVTRRVTEAKKEAEDLGIIWTKSHEDRLKLDILGKNMGNPAPDKVNHFAKLKAEVLATTDALQENIKMGEKATASEKLKYKLERGGDTDYNKLDGKGKSAIMELVESNIKSEEKIAADKKLLDVQSALNVEREKYATSLTSGNNALDDEIIRTQMQIANLTLSKAAVKDLAATEMEREAEKARIEASFVNRDTDEGAYNLLVARAQKYQELADLKRDLGAGQDEKAAFDALDKLLDPKKALDFGDALGDAFGSAGEAIGKMSKSLGNYSKMQDKINDERQAFMSIADEKKRTAGLTALDRQERQSKLRMYGDMAGASKEFFSENTAAYRLLSIVEQGFRAAELAGALYNAAVKSGLVTAFTGLFVTAKAVETGVETTKTAVSVGLAGTEASAWGITAVVKSLASLPFPFNIAAGAVTLAAVIAAGASMMGSSSGSGSSFNLKEHQAEQNTGTVLGGDKETKSESLAKAMDLVADNSNIGLVLTSNMLSSLRGIEASMQGLASAIFKVNGMTTGKNFGVTEGTTSKGLISSIFGGKTTTTILDTGLTLKGTANDFKAGAGAQQYVDVNKQKSGGWFSSSKSWNERSYMDADNEVTTTIGRVFASINDTISGAAESLGANGTAVQAALDAFVISTEVSFKDLKGDELTQALEDMFSASADGMARAVFGGLDAFQAAGEGYYETIVRVAVGSEQAANALSSFGIGMVDIHSLTNKTGDVASQLVRESILAVEAGTAIANIMKVMDGSMSDLVDGYKALLSIQDTMNAASLGSGVSVATIRGAGGLVEMESAISGFIEAMYTDVEKQAISVSKLQAEFKRLNVAMPETKDGFKSLVTELMVGGEQSQELAGRVLLLSESFADVMDAAKDLAETAKDVAQEAIDALVELAEKTADRMSSAFDAMNSAGNILDKIDSTSGGKGNAYALLREQSLWASMAKADYKQQIELAGELADSVINRYKIEKDNSERLLDFARSLRTYVDGLKIGSLSPLTTSEKLAEAANQYTATLAKAKTGDETAMKALQGASSSYLDLARQYYASSTGYVDIFNGVTGSLDALGVTSQTEAQMQLGVSSQSLEELRRLQELVKDAYNQAAVDLNTEKLLMQRQVDEMLRTADGIEAVRDLLSGMAAELAGQLNGGAATDPGGYQMLAKSYVALLGGRGGSSTDTSYVAAAMANTNAANWEAERNSAMNLLTDPAMRAQMEAIFHAVGRSRLKEINGSHADGLDYVPFDGYIAELHEGESVLTASENRARMAGKSVPGKDEGMAEMAAEIRTLNSKIDTLTKQNEQLMIAQIRATVESNEDNANKIVQGVARTSERAAHAVAITPEGYN